MATQSQQARSHHARQAAIAAAAAESVGGMFKAGRTWSEILNQVAAYQLAAVTTAISTLAGLSGRAPVTSPRAYAGVSSAGYPIAEPIVATIDRVAPAPTLEPLPAQWWDDTAAFQRQVEQLIESEIQDAARSAFQAELVVDDTWQNYVRVLVPPSCSRCAVLAGRIYRDLDGFERHPKCDCQHWPVQDWEEAHDAGVVFSARELFDRGQIRGLSKADEQAIRDGADIGSIVNTTRGTSTPGRTAAYTTDLLGRRVKATTAGTTRRSAWRRANPSRRVRLRPESIYEIARDHDDAIRLLGVYGYLAA